MLKQLVETILSGASRLEAQLVAAEAELQTKRAVLNTLLLESGADGPAAAKASDAVDAAERRVKHLQAALQAAHAKHAAQQAEAKQDAKQAAWQAAARLADERHAAIVTLAASAAAFAADYSTVLKINSDLLAALPANPDSIANLTDRFALETALRKQLVKLGLPWAFTWPYGKVNLPDLLPQSEGALSVVREAVSKATR